MVYNDGSEVSSLAPMGRNGGGRAGNAKTMVLTVPRGGTYNITLSDGTKVKLNAFSRLTYPVNLNERGERRVRLEGEGWFEVAKDKKRPFRVEGGGQVIEVLGTHFNINTYKDKGKTITTLLEGSVRVFTPPFYQGGVTEGGGGNNGKTTPASPALLAKWGSVTLKPNQQSVLANNTLTIGEADPAATAWVNGKFRFNNTPLADVMKQLGRWYDVEVVYPQGIPEERMTGDFNRSINASQALKILQIVGVKFKIEGKKIIVLK